MTWPDIIRTAIDELAFKTEAHKNMWGFGSESDWVFDQEQGELVWQFPGGRCAKAPAEVVGTFNEKTQVWLWAWANSSIEEKLTKAACAAQQYGEANGIAVLVEPRVSAGLQQCWELAAVAMHLSAMQGVYQGRSGHLRVFFCFGQVSITAAVSHPNQDTAPRR